MLQNLNHLNQSLDHKFDIGAELDLNKSLEDSDIDLSNSSAASVWED